MNDLATNALWSRQEIESPCVKICVIHPTAGICAGCFRTRDEIARWSTMGTEGRRAIMMELPGRKGELKKRRGGRAARIAESKAAE